MQTAEQVKRDLIWEERIRSGDSGDPYRPPDEDEPLAVDICNTTPHEQEAAEGESIAGNDPLQAAFGNGEVTADGGQDDDNALIGHDLRYTSAMVDPRLASLSYVSCNPSCKEVAYCLLMQTGYRRLRNENTYVEERSTSERQDEGDAACL